MKLVVTEYVSLDGVAENPIWIAPYFNEEFLKFKFDELFGGDALLMGRVTYEYFLPVWINATPADDAPGQEGFAERITQLPKYVISSTMQKAEWNNSHIIRANVVEEVARLKAQPGGDILVAGSSTLVKTLMEHDLVDEYRFLVYPLVVGAGKRLFLEGSTAKLQLKESRAFSTGVILLIYTPAR
jgi:dihydrofolate reductase